MSDSGYSGTPLPKKLGLKPEFATLFIGLPQNLSYLTDGLPAAQSCADLASVDGASLDYIHLFEVSRAALKDQAPHLKTLLKPTGMLWISWPKKASKVPTTITEDVLREIFLPTGLVDVKVCALDDIWSGLKFVLRKELR